MQDSIITNQWLTKMLYHLGSLKNWLWDGNIPNDLGSGLGECTCGKKHIRYEYKIINHQTHEERIVGSSCYLKFVHHTTGLPYDEIQSEMKQMESLAYQVYKEKVFLEALEEAKTIDNYVQKGYHHIKNYFYTHEGDLKLSYVLTLAIALWGHPAYEKLKHVQVNLRLQEERNYLAKMKPHVYHKIHPILQYSQQGDYYERYRTETHQKRG